MKTKIFLLALFIIIILGVGYLYQTVPSKSEIKTVNMINNQGEPMGTISLSETKAGVLLNVDLNGLTPDGEHAIHIHEKGACTPLESFTDAGGHYNPETKAHGLKHPEGHHAGDMPNLKPDAKGHIQTAFMNLSVTLNKDKTGKRNSVYDADGSAIVVHANADDHMSQPSGDAGGRIACGVIE